MSHPLPFRIGFLFAATLLLASTVLLDGCAPKEPRSLNTDGAAAYPTLRFSQDSATFAVGDALSVEEFRQAYLTPEAVADYDERGFVIEPLDSALIGYHLEGSGVLTRNIEFRQPGTTTLLLYHRDGNGERMKTDSMEVIIEVPGEPLCRATPASFLAGTLCPSTDQVSAFVRDNGLSLAITEASLNENQQEAERRALENDPNSFMSLETLAVIDMALVDSAGHTPAFDPQFAEARYTVCLPLEGILAEADPASLTVSMYYEAGDSAQLDSWTQDGCLYFVTSPTTLYQDMEGTPYFDEAYLPRHIIRGQPHA